MAILPIEPSDDLGEVQQILAEELYRHFHTHVFGWIVEFKLKHITFSEPKSHSQTRLTIRFESTFAVLTIDKVMLKQRPGLDEVCYDYCDPAFPDNLKDNVESMLEEAEWMFNSYQ